MNPETQYYGRPCKHGHGATEGQCLRFRSGHHCVECHKADNRRHYEKHREELRVQNRKRGRQRWAEGRHWAQQPENQLRAAIHRSQYAIRQRQEIV